MFVYKMLLDYEYQVGSKYDLIWIDAWKVPAI